MNKLVVISGCSGGGKSTLISELEKQGYTVIHEVGRKLVKELQNDNNIITPSQNPQAFCEILIERSIAEFHRAKNLKNVKENIVFFDRCFLEGVSFCQSLHIKSYDCYIRELRYYPIIFMTPPWKEIFTQDDERKHSFEEAVSEYDRIIKDYPQYGYEIKVLPKVNIAERINFIFSHLKNYP